MSAQPSTITCPRCGERLPEGFTRCDACGAYLVPHPSSAAPAPAAERSTKRGRNIVARPSPVRSGASPLIYLLVGLVAGGGIGYALRSGVSPSADGGGAPAVESSGSMGAAPGGTAGAPGGTASGGIGSGQMPPEITAQVQKYRSALMMDPNDLEANIGLGNLLFDSNQWDKAIEHYTKALAKDPSNADVRVDRAIAYHSLGQDPKAKEEMLRVTREHPEHVNAWLNLGVVSAGLGDKATAIRAWEQYLKLEPNGTHAAAIRSELADLKKTP